MKSKTDNMADLEKMSSATFESKKDFKLPEGAQIIKNEYTLTVREIENGFIIRKSYDIKYTINGDNNYEYFTKEYYSKQNPMKVDIKEKSLADKF